MSTPTPKHMRRFFPDQEKSEDFSNGNLVWLQEIIKDKYDNLVVKRTLFNSNRPVNEKYDKYEIKKIREMNNSLGVYSGCKRHSLRKRHFFKKILEKNIFFIFKNKRTKDIIFVRPGRIELPSHPWQGRVLPLNHDR